MLHCYTHNMVMLYFKIKVCREPGSQGLEILICMSHVSCLQSRCGASGFPAPKPPNKLRKLLVNRHHSSLDQIPLEWRIYRSIPSPAKVPLSTREYPFAKGREGTKVSHAPGGNARNSRPRSGPWKQCERLQSDEMNDTSWYFQFTRCFRQSNGAKVDIEMSRSPSSIERYRTYQYSYNDNQWQMTANSWRWHVNTLQAKPSHEIKLAAQQCFCNMSSRCLRQLGEQAAQQSSQPRVMILSLLDLGLRWFLRSWSENDQDGTARNWHYLGGWQHLLTFWLPDPVQLKRLSFSLVALNDPVHRPSWHLFGSSFRQPKKNSGMMLLNGLRLEPCMCSLVLLHV